MEGDRSLKLTDREVEQAFSDPAGARYGPVLTLEEAAELMRMELSTLRAWRSQGRLSSCSVKAGKKVKVFRNRLIKAIFNDLVASIDD